MQTLIRLGLSLLLLTACRPQIPVEAPLTPTRAAPIMSPFPTPTDRPGPLPPTTMPMVAPTPGGTAPAAVSTEIVTPGTAVLLPSPAAISPAELPLLALAQAADAERYAFAVSQGARFFPTSDGRSFYLIWTPPGFEQSTRRPALATLHGHGSWALDEFYLWQPFAQEHGYALVALQWWFGGGETPDDYYAPQEMYPLLAAALTTLAVPPGHALLHGFSRGATNTYALTALDRQHQAFFGLTVSNSGGAAADYPPTAQLIQGVYGASPLAGAHWVMYCGERDPNPDRDGCPAMRAARDFVTGLGATVELLIDDPTGDHGGFHRNPDNVEQALQAFEAVLNR